MLFGIHGATAVGFTDLAPYEFGANLLSNEVMDRTFCPNLSTFAQRPSQCVAFFFSGIYLPDDTKVSFFIQCSRAHQWTLRLVGVREPDVLHDLHDCMILQSLLVWQCYLCYVAMRLLVAAVCVLHCVGHLGTVVGAGGGGGRGEGT